MDFTMGGLIVGLVYLAIPLLIAFVLVYWAVRLAIRHERDRDRRQ
jgi:ABC-type tungstate transport system substrate-binding protein